MLSCGLSVSQIIIDRVSELYLRLERQMEHVLVLSFSIDPTLLETRNRILKDVGYTVIPAFSTEDAENKFLESDFDLAILCHSIPTHDRQYLSQIIHQRSPSTPVILISGARIERDPHIDAIISNDPEQLLAKLASILRNRKRSSIRRQKRA